MEERIKIAITQGDINGIGYEILLKAFSDKYLRAVCIPIVYGSPKVLAYYKKVLNLEHVKHNTIRYASEAVANQINVIACNDDAVKVEIGLSTKDAGKAAFESLERAVSDMQTGQLQVLVTCPINKDNVQNEDFKFPGHTEYLAQRFGVQEALMLMVHENLRVGVVTGHIPLQKITNVITYDLLWQKIQDLNTALRYNFGLIKPKIAVLGINPHCGDNGLLGTEEKEVIQPMLEKAKQEGILAMGPYSADGFFGSGAYTKYDAILAMYHDQGLIPFKTLALGGGVNATLGLPIVRTSPAHGTAYEIAGKGEASAESFKEAIFEAIDIYRERQYQDEAKANSLPVKKRQERTKRRYPQIN